MRRTLLLLALGLPSLTGCVGDPVKPPPPAAGFVPTPAPPTTQARAVAVIKKARGKVTPDSVDPDQPVLIADLHNVPITGEILDAVTALPKLKELNLYKTGFTDDDLTRLAGLKELQTLNLCSSRVTDAGLASLRALPALRSLYLHDTAVTDAGAPQLVELRTCKTWT